MGNDVINTISWDSLDKLWLQILDKKIRYRKSGEKFLVTITDNIPTNYNSAGNICVLFINSSCIALYELVKRYNGNFKLILNIIMKKGVSINESLKLLDDMLNIFCGNMKYIKTDDTFISTPYFAHIDITSKCNMTCLHCLNPSEKYDSDDLDIDSWLQVLEELANFGISVLWIGGGEPLLRDDILTILEYANTLNMRIVLATNGLLLDDFIYSTNLLSLIDEITICLDGGTSKIHSFFRKPENSYERIINNIKITVPIAHENKCLVKIFTCVAKHNIGDIENIIDISYQLGADSWSCQAFVPLQRGANFADQVISYEMREELAKIITQKRNEYANIMQIQYYIPLLTMKKMYSKPKMECAAGNAIIYISSCGYVYPCSRLVMDKFLVGHISNMDFSRVWANNSVLSLLRNIDYKATFCGKCDFFVEGKCNGGCKAEKFREYGDIFEKPDPSCRFAIKGGEI
jgi:radical SAM protein with 4Fe4S-binding SPASM domain